MSLENNELLEAAAELVVTLRAWGLHHTGMLLTRDADTGKPVLVVRVPGSVWKPRCSGCAQVRRS